MVKRAVQYQVRDYETWRSAFEANEPARTAATFSNPRIYRTFYGDAAASIAAWLNANAPRNA